MKKNKITQIIATLALFSIIIGVIGTGILIIFSGNSQQQIELTPEQLQELINAQSGAQVQSGETLPADLDDIIGLDKE